MKIKYLIVSIISFITLNEVSAQGALDGFIDQPGQKALAVSVGTEKANVFFKRDEDLKAPRRFDSASLFYKHQFNKWFGIAVNVPVVEGQLHDGFVYLKFGKQFKLNNNLQLSTVLGVGGTTPFSNYDAETGDAIGQQASALNLRFISQLIIKNRVFINARVGHDEVSTPTPSKNLYSFKIGYFKDKWYADLWYEDIHALGGKDYQGVGQFAPQSFRELGVSSQKIGGVIYHQTWKNVGLFFNSAKVLGGRNAWGTMRYSGGFVWNLKTKKKTSSS